MRARISIFRSVVLILLPVILIAELIIMLVSHAAISKITYKQCSTEIEKNAAVVEYVVAEYDLDNPEEAKECSRKLDELCIKMDAPYIYAIEIDEQAQTEKYLALGFGKDATAEAKNSRYNGYVLKTELNPEIIDTLHQDCEDHLRRVDNKFGNALICYRRIHNDATKTRIIGVEKSISEIMKELNTVFRIILIMMLVFTVISVLSFAYIVYHKVSKPARKISDKMNHFVSERRDKNLKIEPQGSREFNSMANAFNSMTDEINQYICDIESLNREKHMQEAELNIARNIQNGFMAPDSFANCFVNIDAYMLPAKEVGGDMYDYKVSENGEICFVVADVSGKGVSASLFMARAVTLLQILAQMGVTPSEAAREFNNMLAQNNPKKLFITAFLAKYDPKTKKLTYTNAGHNPPYIISDKLQIIDGAHGMAAGVFPDITYEEEEITLNDGDTLFVFTDGVNEAQNCSGEMLTTETLESILTEYTEGNKKEIISGVRGKIKEFSAGAVQSDDITMLTLTVKKPYRKNLHLKSDVNKLVEINALIDAIPDLSFDDKCDLKLMAEEIFVNICSYSYPDSLGDVEFCIEATDKAKMVFTDYGIEYDPTVNILDIETYDHNNTIGGLGRYITFNIADEYEYRYDNGKNILKLVKNVSYSR